MLMAPVIDGPPWGYCSCGWPLPKELAEYAARERELAEARRELDEFVNGAGKITESLRRKTSCQW